MQIKDKSCYLHILLLLHMVFVLYDNSFFIHILCQSGRNTA